MKKFYLRGKTKNMLKKLVFGGLLVSAIVGGYYWSGLENTIETEIEVEEAPITDTVLAHPYLIDIMDYSYTAPDELWQEGTALKINFLDIQVHFFNGRKEAKNLAVGNFFLMFERNGQKYRMSNLPYGDVVTFTKATVPSSDSTEFKLRFEVPVDATDIKLGYVDEVFVDKCGKVSRNAAIDVLLPIE